MTYCRPLIKAVQRLRQNQVTNITNTIEPNHFNFNEMIQFWKCNDLSLDDYPGEEPQLDTVQNAPTEPSNVSFAYPDPKEPPLPTRVQKKSFFADFNFSPPT